jgi:hypothetical protein
MDEREFQQVREQLNQHPCPFEKAILSSCCCTKCQRLNLAERETAACLSATAQARCAKLLDQLYQNARFAIKTVRLVGRPPHAKAMKVQCGGLIGLQSVLIFKVAFETIKEGFETKQVKDIDTLITEALEQLDRVEKFPYQEIVKFISHYQVRAKRAHS